MDRRPDDYNDNKTRPSILPPATEQITTSITIPHGKWYSQFNVITCDMYRRYVPRGEEEEEAEDDTITDPYRVTHWSPNPNRWTTTWEQTQERPLECCTAGNAKEVNHNLTSSNICNPLLFQSRSSLALQFSRSLWHKTYAHSINRSLFGAVAKLSLIVPCRRRHPHTTTTSNKTICIRTTPIIIIMKKRWPPGPPFSPKPPPPLRQFSANNANDIFSELK